MWRYYQATATIQAPPYVAWSILTDAPGYPAWGSGVGRVDGAISDGPTITVHAEVNPGGAFPVKVRLDGSGHSMTWSGGTPLGLFKGVRTFTLTLRATPRSTVCARRTPAPCSR